MEKFTVLFLTSISLFLNEVNCQNLIAVQNGNTPTFFQTLDLAITNAQNGDTIYMPGGTFSLSVDVDKRLHMIGAGYNPDSTLATGQTKINGTLNLSDNASEGSIKGVYILGSINSGESTSGYLVFRCRLEGGLAMAINAPQNQNNGWSFIENVIRSGINNNLSGSSGCFFSNNIIDASCSNFYGGFTNSVFKNNIFLYQGLSGYGFLYAPIRATHSQFENNIFISTQLSNSLVEHSSFYNNIFVAAESSIYCTECWGSNNITEQSQSDIFINQTGNNFSYSHDYHLQPTSPGKNAGKDGTDIGIYGGAFPWKAGSVPPNPHIRFENVSGVDDAGNIHVVVKVAAQDR